MSNSLYTQPVEDVWKEKQNVVGIHRCTVCCSPIHVHRL